MGNGRDVYGSALRELRGRLEAGSTAPGTLLAINDLAQAFGISTTPVREALVRLSGEGLVAETRGRGFAIPALDRARLLDLYRMHRAQLDAILQDRLQAPQMEVLGVSSLRAAGSSDASSPPALLSAMVFARLAEGCSGETMLQLHWNVLTRMACARAAEIDLFEEVGSELRAIDDARSKGDEGALRAAVQQHDRMRLRRLDSVVAQLRRSHDSF